jgi:beta-lactam-binding protein with PASTA domain
MSGRRIVASSLIVIAIGFAFLGGYVVGRGDRTTVPDLYGLGEDRGGQAEARGTLKKADLRLGLVRFYVCGDEGDAGMIVRHVPSPGESVPMGTTVDIQIAVPIERTTLLSDDDERQPCPDEAD